MLSSIKKESAHTQTDVGFISDLSDELNGIRGNMLELVDSGFFNYSVVTLAPWYKQHCENINKILKKRFGVNFRLVTSEYGADLATLTTPPPRFNIYKGDTIANILKSYGDVSKVAVDPESVKSRHADADIIDLVYVKSVRALDDKLKSENIYIDYNEAKIYNLPDNYVVYIIWNPLLLLKFKNVELSLRNIISGLIHEIGHTFDMLDNSFRTTRCMVDVMDSVKTEVDLRGGSPLDGIRIAYDNITGESSKGMNIANLVMTLVNHTKSYYGYDRGSYGNKSSERMADAFAAQFGLAGDLAEYLKIMDEAGVSIDTTTPDSVMVLQNIGLITVLCSVLPVSIGLLLTIPLYTIYITLLGNKNPYNGRVYDDPRRRLIKLKQNLIQQLKTVAKDKNTNISSIKERLKDEIANIDELIKMLNTNKKLVATVADRFKKHVHGDRISVNYLMDDLINNDLHYLVEKI